MPIVKIPYKGNEEVTLLKVLSVLLNHGSITLVSIRSYYELFWQHKDLAIPIDESVVEFIRRDFNSFGTGLIYYIE